MFEKGFSSWFKENTPKEGLSENTTFSKQFVIDAWNNGYVTGYNKANEWHFVKDGDLPNNTDNVLSDKGVIVYYNFTHACWVDERASVEIDDVIAWCELPKFKEE